MNHKKTSINQPKNWKSISNHSQGNVSIYLSPSFPSVCFTKKFLEFFKVKSTGSLEAPEKSVPWRFGGFNDLPHHQTPTPPDPQSVQRYLLRICWKMEVLLSIWSLGEEKLRNWWNWLKIAVNVCGWGTVWCCFSLFVGSFCFSGLRFRGGLWSFRYLFLKFASPKEESRDRPWCLWKRQGKKFGFSD